MTELSNAPFQEGESSSQSEHQRHLQRLKLQMEAARKQGYTEEADRLRQTGQMNPTPISGDNVHHFKGVITEDLDLTDYDEDGAAGQKDQTA